MKLAPTIAATLRLIALLLWAGLALWAFSLGFSTGYFGTDLAARLPPFLAAFVGAMALPISAFRQWQRARRGASRLCCWLIHSAIAAASLLPLAGTRALQRLAGGIFQLSADDAMGAGVVFLLLAAAAIASSMLLGGVLLLGRARR